MVGCLAVKLVLFITLAKASHFCFAATKLIGGRLDDVLHTETHFVAAGH